MSTVFVSARGGCTTTDARGVYETGASSASAGALSAQLCGELERLVREELAGTGLFSIVRDEAAPYRFFARITSRQDILTERTGTGVVRRAGTVVHARTVLAIEAAGRTVATVEVGGDATDADVYVRATARTLVDRLVATAPFVNAPSPQTSSRPRGLVTSAGGPVAGGTGSFDADAVRAVIDRAVGATRHCYEARLEHRPAIGGRVVVMLTLTGAGTVSAANANEAFDADVSSCVVNVIRRLRFPGQPGAPATYTFSLTFQPAN